MEISREKFQKTRKLMNFRKANHSTENSEISRVQMELKFPGNLFSKIWVYLRRLPSFKYKQDKCDFVLVTVPS